MSRKLTKEELDEQFELFLKESASDDSVDLGSLEKSTRAKDKGQTSAQKPSVSWWEEDHDKEKPKPRFLKSPKRQVEKSEVDSSRPVPKPRSSAPVQPDTALSLHQGAHGDHTEEAQVSSPDSEPQGSDDGLVGSGKRFLKSLRKSQTIREEDDEESSDRNRRTAKVPKDDASDTHGVSLTPGLSSALGLDTLEEAQEKEQFFAELEAGASSTIDYSKLNKELDSTASTAEPGHRKTEEALHASDKDDKEISRESPGSPHYSEDFEEEDDEKEPEQEQKPKMSPILAKVSLYDSLEEAREDERKKTTSASLDKAQSYVQSGASDLEALHKALQIHAAVQDSEELNRTFTSSPNHNRPQSPRSPPHHRAASTVESDLPTAEELMKPIRPEDDHLRGFSLQPVSVSDQTQSSEPKDSLETLVESQTKARGFEAEKQLLSGWTSSADLLSAPEPPPVQEKPWSIRDEVLRLMHDQESTASAQTNRAKKQQPSRSSGSSQSHLKRPTDLAQVRGRALDSRTTVTSRPSSLPGPATIQTKSMKPSVPQPRSTRVSKGPEKTRTQPEAGAQSSDLVASVQSLVSVLQQQINTKHKEEAAATTKQNQTAQLSPVRQTEDISVLEDLKAQLFEKEKLIEKLKQDSEELDALKQHNYLLQSKLRSAEESLQKNRLTDATDSKNQEKLQQIDKEMKEQETLIQGYQQENERLYQQMKVQQARTKANEEVMFKENQRLLTELTFTREQLNKAQRPVSNLCSMDHSQRITQLLAQINALQRSEERQKEEIQSLKQEKQALEVDLRLLRDQRDRTKDQDQDRTKDRTKEQEQDQDRTKDRTKEQERDQDGTKDRTKEQERDQDQIHVQHHGSSGNESALRVMKQRHEEEVSELKKRLKWFAENQELLDRDAARLRAATAEILQLKEQVEKLKMEVTKQSGQQQKKIRERSADAKRIQHLERQVKELEQMLRSRNPNSLPALIFAAASAGDSTSDPSRSTSDPSRVSVLLERRVQRLEAELEAHDEEAKRSLRAMEQQFQAIRMRYEQQICELEQQLEQKHQKELGLDPGLVQGSDPVLVQSLRDELKRERDAHRQKETTLQNQLDELQQQLKLKSHSSPSRHQRQAEAALGLRLERLNQELSTKSRTIQDLTKTVERLQRERRSMLSAPVPRAEGRAAEARRQAAPNRPAPESHEAAETFPALSACDKTYQPTVFADSHISEVQQENAALKLKLQQLQSDSDRERDELKTALTQTQEKINRLQEEHVQQLSSVQAQSLRDQAQLRSTFALEHSASAVAQLSNQLNAQQMVVQQLQEQLTEAQSWRRALNVSRAREEALQTQLSRCLEDLKEARDNQSPEVKLLWSLERKVQNMETRQQHRDRELQQAIGAARPGSVDLQSELEKWKRLAQSKTRELESFRLELDSILDIIRHLQKQGVVLPAPDALLAALATR